MITIFWAGDSTVSRKSILVYPETGIGQMFDRFVRQFDVQIENHAVNGRSTKQFLDEGRLMPIYDRMRPGDYLFVQFGHNDEKREDPARYADPDGAYCQNLEKFVNAARNKGATPVFITPVARRLFPNPAMNHGAYAAAMKRTAARLGVALIDLTRLGEDSKRLYMNLPAGVYPHFPDGLTDNTHLTPEGALTYAALVARGLGELGGEYAALLSDDYGELMKEMGQC